MNRAKSILSRACLFLAPLGAVAMVASSDAAAQYVAPPPPPPPQGVIIAPPPPPPPAFIATVQPQYYEGHATYLYNDHWYYRDAHGAWNYYHTEPAYLHQRRPVVHSNARYHYHR